MSLLKERRDGHVSRTNEREKKMEWVAGVTDAAWGALLLGYRRR